MKPISKFLELDWTTHVLIGVVLVFILFILFVLFVHGYISIVYGGEGVSITTNVDDDAFALYVQEPKKKKKSRM